MRLPNTAHTSRPWRIHELTPDFQLEDVWALRTTGGPGELPRLVSQTVSGNFLQGAPLVVRVLWAARWKIGRLLRWDGPDTGLGSRVPTLRDRFPTDLRGAPTGPDFDTLPFTSLYQLENEFAAEMANRTVQAVMHLSWVPEESGGYRGQLAVLVKPNGLFGTVYMAAIKPIRSMIVYPALMGRKERKWRAPAGDPAPAQPSDREPSNGNEAMATAETIAVPAGVAELAALGTVDYQEAFAFDTDAVLTPEEWARLILEGAPQTTRTALLGAWKRLRVTLAPLESDGQLLGWPIQHSGSQDIVLAVESEIGFSARMVIQAQPGRVIHAMLFRFERDAGRDAFLALAPRHTEVVRSLLDDANRRAATAATRPTPERES